MATVASLQLKNVIPTHAPTLEAMLKTVTTAQPTVAMLARLPLINKTVSPGPAVVAASTLTKPTAPAPMAQQQPIGGSTGGVKKKSSEAAASSSQPRSPRRPPAKKQVKRSRSCENPVKSGEW